MRRFDVPFHHVPHEGQDRASHERALQAVLDRYDPEYLVLAKFMRVLSSAFVARYAGRIINIHHSFLPAFVGARPYQQAFERGVKIIGATAHIVTDDLDTGPIIAQDVRPVTHAHTAADMARAGRDVEKIVLAHGLTLAPRGACLPQRRPRRGVRVSAPDSAHRRARPLLSRAVGRADWRARQRRRACAPATPWA